MLDLDHTLLNSARYAEVHPALHAQLEQRCAWEAKALPEQERLLFPLEEIKVAARGGDCAALFAGHCSVVRNCSILMQVLRRRLGDGCAMHTPLGERAALSWESDACAALQMWTKLRPGVRQFLQTAAQHYELWIHTNGMQPLG